MQTKSQSENNASKGLKNLEDITNQALAISSDVLTGKVTHQRGTASVGALRAALNGIELHHNLGGDVSAFIKSKPTTT